MATATTLLIDGSLNTGSSLRFIVVYHTVNTSNNQGMVHCYQGIMDLTGYMRFISKPRYIRFILCNQYNRDLLDMVVLRDLISTVDFQAPFCMWNAHQDPTSLVIIAPKGQQLLILGCPLVCQLLNQFG